MSEYNKLIYKQLKLHVSFDLYDDYGYISKIKEPFELCYAVHGDHHPTNNEIESVVNTISNTIKSYLLSEL